MMMMAMLETEFKGKTVADFGTGTGILSILAVQLGAKSVAAIDNDDWSIENV
jgi:ribosomal protein L11 methyltransferase